MLLRDLADGASYPFRALAVINRNPALWKYVVAPIALNISVGAAIYVGLLVGGLAAIDAWLGQAAGALEAVVWVLRVVLSIALVVGVGYVLVRFGVVLGSPFYGRLSERLELLRAGHAPTAEPLSAGSVARDLSRALLYELKKLALLLLLGVPLLLIGLIPAVGALIATAGWVALGALIACLDFLDSPLERRRLRFRDKLGAVRRGLPFTAGFGLVCFGLVSIPLINLLSIPLCVTAGTLLFSDRLAARVERP